MGCAGFSSLKTVKKILKQNQFHFRILYSQKIIYFPVIYPTRAATQPASTT